MCFVGTMNERSVLRSSWRGPSRQSANCDAGLFLQPSNVLLSHSVRPQLRTGIAEKRPRSPNTTTRREGNEQASERGLEFRPLRATLFLSERTRTKLIRPLLLFPLDKQGPARFPCMTFVECFTFPLAVHRISKLSYRTEFGK